MPIYEFYCRNNHRIYSFYARSLSYADRTPRCPDDERFQMEKMISSFAITGRAKEKESATGDDPRMEAMMAEMAGEMGDMDGENPDPKALARMMRRMAEMNGAKMPAAVEEMMSRMAAGEDPEKLEEQFGGAMEDFEKTFDAEGGEGASAKLKAQWRALSQPQRDPTLYEMSEYVEAKVAKPVGAKGRIVKTTKKAK